MKLFKITPAFKPGKAKHGIIKGFSPEDTNLAWQIGQLKLISHSAIPPLPRLH
jgi:hypothetical protein